MYQKNQNKSQAVSNGEVRIPLLATVVRNALAWGGIITFKGKFYGMPEVNKEAIAKVLSNPGVVKAIQIALIAEKLTTDKGFCTEMQNDFRDVYVKAIASDKRKSL